MNIGIIGLGYVGLPLSLTFAESGVTVLGLDLDPSKIEDLSRGRSYIKHISANRIKKVVDQKLFSASTDFSKVKNLDAIIICVPTPLNKFREPDISYVIKSGEAIAPHLSKETLVVLESTTYPGTTEDELRVAIEANSNMKAGIDFHLAY